MSLLSPVITLDGPSGVGKGVTSQLLARHLGWHLLDSGALYRVLALAAHKHDVEFSNEEALVLLAAHLDVQFHEAELGEHCRIILEGEEVTDAIRSEAMSQGASAVAVLPRVREALLRRQRAFRQNPGLIADGRDMGTIVFADADLKYFLDASPEERARRRHRQLSAKGQDVNIGDLLRDIVERDSRDRNRSVAPLQPAADAIVLDTTHLSVQQVLDTILGQVRERGFKLIA